MPFIAVIMAFFLGFASPEKAHSLTWKMPPEVFLTAPNGLFVLLAADPEGNAFSAYLDTSNRVTVSHFSKTLQDYEAPVLVAPSVETFAIATDASQTGLLLWRANDFSNDILSAFYNGTSWVTPTPSPLTSIPQAFPQVSVAMNGSGNGLGAWDQVGITAPGDVIVSFFNGNTITWGPLQILNPSGTGGEAPVVGYSSNGTAVAVWMDSASNLVASNFNGTSWTALPPIIGTNVSDYNVQIDASGHAIAIWKDSISSNVFANFYNGTSWGVAQNISIVPMGFTSPTLALAPTGSAIVVWVDPAGVGFYAEFISGSWTLPISFTPSASTTSVAVDSFGNALITWDDGSNVFSISKPFGGPLGPIDHVTTSDLLSVPIAALSDNGRGFIDGIFAPGEGSGISGTFSLLIISTPVISGRVCKNKFAAQTEHVHVITFIPVTDPTVVSYHLSRNGVLIAVIPSTGPFIYFDHNRCRRDVYTLTAVNSAGIAGPAATIILR